LALSSSTQQQSSAYPTEKWMDEIDVTLIKETEYALKTMREYTENYENDNVFTRLIIEEPEEFRGKFVGKMMRTD
jgi:hypothetical protein